MPDKYRTIFFISDGTGITAEMLGHSLLSQFEDIKFRQETIPFVDTAEKAGTALERIAQAGKAGNGRPIVFTSLVNTTVRASLRSADALVLDFFETFIGPLELELGQKSTHTMGRSHSATDQKQYQHRIEAVNFALAHDDGQSNRELAKADVILVGVSRSGKTPTSLYLALQFGVLAANYPLIPDDFDRDTLPSSLLPFRNKLFGLTIVAERLAEIRKERRPNSQYALLANCRREVEQAESLMRREGIRWLNSTTKSIEEISTTILQEVGLERRVY
ncbi:MAG: pyruvate, water dikinase regulatory protein [Betaproteobacteria bacterium]